MRRWHVCGFFYGNYPVRRVYDVTFVAFETFLGEWRCFFVRFNGRNALL